MAIPYQTKKLAREAIKEIGAAYPDSFRIQANRIISSRLLDIVNKTELPVLGFVPHGDNEPDIKGVLTELAVMGRLYLPYWESALGLAFYKTAAIWESSIEKVAHNKAQKIRPNSEQFGGGDGYIFVPGVAFDNQNNRLGRGGGYYDRFFAEDLASKLNKIGVAYPYQILPPGSFPVLNNDVKVDTIVSS